MSLRKKMKICKGYVFERVYTKLDSILKYYKAPCRVCDLYYRNYCGSGNNKMALICIEINTNQLSEPTFKIYKYMYKGVSEKS